MGINFGAGRRIQHRNLEASKRRCIRHKAAGAILPRGDADPFAGGQQMTPMREPGSDVDNLLDVVAHNDAVALEHGAVTGIRASAAVCEARRVGRHRTGRLW